MTGRHDRRALSGELAKCACDQLFVHGCDPVKGLVDKQTLRRPNHGSGDGDTSAFARTQLVEASVQRVVQGQCGDDLVDRLPAVPLADEPEVRFHRERAG